jgi:hypothetical protein
LKGEEHEEHGKRGQASQLHPVQSDSQPAGVARKVVSADLHGEAVEENAGEELADSRPVPSRGKDEERRTQVEDAA